MKRQYKHVLFDLDHTLWDFDSNCATTLLELFENHELAKLLNCEFNQFKKQYLKTNAQLWAKYNNKEVTKDEMRQLRFNLVLLHFGLNNNTFALQLNDEYVDSCPKKGELITGAKEILKYLQPNYTLHILTNGFQETQETKLEHAGISSYFNTMTTSESCGVTKPNPLFFKHHLAKINAIPSECIMIGDNINTDIRGANASKIDSILFDPTNSDKFFRGKQTYLITDLLQLKNIL